VLRQRHIEHRTRRSVQAPACKLRVAHHADDAKRADIFGQVQPELLGERIFVALEKALDERLVDDRDRCGGFVVRRWK
jgi:hypothetical protein